MIIEILMGIVLLLSIVAAILEFFFCEDVGRGYPEIWASPTVETIHDLCVVIAMTALIGAALCGICGVG